MNAHRDFHKKLSFLQTVACGRFARFSRREESVFPSGRLHRVLPGTTSSGGRGAGSAEHGIFIHSENPRHAAVH